MVGDSTSDQLGEWANVLAQEFGAIRHTEIRRVYENEAGFADPFIFSAQEPKLTIWNGSVKASPDAGRVRLVKLIPKKPNVVLISQGRDVDPAKIADQLNKTVTSLEAVYPDAEIVVVLQPAVGGRDGVDAVRAWAKTLNLPTIDVAKAFAKAKGTPLTANGELTEAGRHLWAKTVFNALT